jgi:shikimate dehydrogenase
MAMKDADLLINATPMGSSYGAPMRPEILEALAQTARGAVVFDMNYDPLETELMQAARLSGLTPVSGIDMLVGQAHRAFELLFGRPPPAEVASAAFRSEAAGPYGIFAGQEVGS